MVHVADPTARKRKADRPETDAWTDATGVPDISPKAIRQVEERAAFVHNRRHNRKTTCPDLSDEHIEESIDHFVRSHAKRGWHLSTRLQVPAAEFGGEPQARECVHAHAVSLQTFINDNHTTPRPSFVMMVDNFLQTETVTQTERIP